jgi:DNA-binding IclR family transcriptional regulator
MAQPNDIQSKAPAITRAVAVMRLLGKNARPLGVQAIARELGMVPSTCLYVLRALTAEGLVAFDDSTKQYRLDAGILTLARDWLRHNRFSDIAQPALDQFARDHSLTALAIQIVGSSHFVVVASSQGGNNFQIAARIGSRFPLLISATGRCIAAFGGLNPATLRDGFDKLRWDNPPDFDTWMGQVEQTKARGYAVDDGHYMAGLTVLAAPVWAKPGSPRHALVALGLSGTLRDTSMESMGEELHRLAQNVTNQMGG